jgi:hypothetical protein
MISLPDLAAQLNDSGLINKTFMDMTRAEILLMVSAVFSSIGDEVPPAGWAKPTIVNDSLIIGFDSHPKYRWWTTDGQSVLQTLIEIDAPWPVAKKYLDGRGIQSMTESDYMNRLIPF